MSKLFLGDIHPVFQSTGDFVNIRYKINGVEGHQIIKARRLPPDEVKDDPPSCKAKVVLGAPEKGATGIEEPERQSRIW